MSYIHIICTCSCALFICACLISAHMYIAYVHIRARHRGKKVCESWQNWKMYCSICRHVYLRVCRCFSSFQQFATSSIRLQHSHCVCCIDVWECLYQSFLGHHAWGCTFMTISLLLPHLPKFIISKRVAATHQTFISHLGHPSSIYPWSQPFHSRDLKRFPRESSNMTLMIKIPPVSCPMFYLAKYQPLIGEHSQPCFMTPEGLKTAQDSLTKPGNKSTSPRCSSVHHETITTLPRGSLLFQHSLKRQPALSWRWQVSWRSWGNWLWVGVSNHPRTKK